MKDFVSCAVCCQNQGEICVGEIEVVALGEPPKIFVPKNARVFMFLQNDEGIYVLRIMPEA